MLTTQISEPNNKAILKLTNISKAYGYWIIVLILSSIPVSCTGQSQDSYKNLYDVSLLRSYLKEVTLLDSNAVATGSNSVSVSDEIPGKAPSFINESTDLDFEGVGLSGEAQLVNTLLLITYNTYCGFCIAELDFWNGWYASNREGSQPISVKLIVVEESLQNVRNFLQRNNYKMPTYQDSSLLMTEWVESYQIPLKIFVNEHGIVWDVRPMGINEDMNRYVRSVLN